MTEAKTDKTAIDPSEFPALPANHARGMPVFLEPVALSGERLCVLLVSQVDDGPWDIATVLDSQQRQCLFGGQADRAGNLIDACQASLRKHLESGLALESWASPLSSFFTGGIVQAKVHDLLMMRRSLARSSSVMSWSMDLHL